MHGGKVLKHMHPLGKPGFVLLFLCIFLILTAGIALASEQPDLLGAPPAQGVANETCLSCHVTPGMQTELPSGEILPLTVDPEVFNNSVHGQQGYACVQCHVDIKEFPPPSIRCREQAGCLITLLSKLRSLPPG